MVMVLVFCVLFEELWGCEVEIKGLVWWRLVMYRVIRELYWDLLP